MHDTERDVTSAPAVPPAVASQRMLIVGILVATLMALAIVIASLACGGGADPPTLRAAATLLDGPWRFHLGDDPRWAAAGTDDIDWETADLTALLGSHDGDVGLPDYVGGWMAHGHPGYHGYAWYRRTVTVPAGRASWDILGPTLVEDGYELYWNGQLLGGSGQIGAAPRVVGTRPMQFALPADAAGTRGVLAVRTYMQPSSGVSGDGGGMHTAPILAPRPVSGALHRVQWERTIAGYIVDLIEPIAMLALAGLALGLRSRSSRKGFLALASIALALTAAKRLSNAIVSWTDLEDLATYVWLSPVVWEPAGLAAWTMAWNRWCLRSWRSIDVAAVVLAVAATIGAVIHSASVTSGSRFGSIALFVVIGARIVRGGPMRIMALATMAWIMAGQFGGELGAIGVPGIWFPFGIGVSRTQYVYAVAVVLLAFLVVKNVAHEEHAIAHADPR